MGVDVRMTVYEKLSYTESEKVGETVRLVHFLDFSFRIREIQEQIWGGFLDFTEEKNPHRFGVIPKPFAVSPEMEMWPNKKGDEIPHYGWVPPSELKNLLLRQEGELESLIRLIAGWDDECYIVAFDTF